MAGELIRPETGQAKLLDSSFAPLPIKIGEVTWGHPAAGRGEDKGNFDSHSGNHSPTFAPMLHFAESRQRIWWPREVFRCHDRHMAASNRGNPEPSPEYRTSALPPLEGEPSYVSGTRGSEPPLPPVPFDDKKSVDKKGKNVAPAGKDVMHTRAGSWWTSLIVGALLLIMLLVFILQNGDDAPIRFLVWTWDIPLGVGLLGAAILGVLLAATIGGIRILQLRRAAKPKK